MVWAILNPDQQAALAEITKFNSDRIAAILGGAMLDDSLRRTIEDRLRPSEDINGKLFKISGPLSGLGPKIDLAYQLYMFDKPMRNAMYGINEIRNSFAHNMSTSFKSSDKKILEALGKMNLHKTEKKYQPPGIELSPALATSGIYDVEPAFDEKSQYIVNLKLCLMWLMGDFGRHMPNSNVPKP